MQDNNRRLNQTVYLFVFLLLCLAYVLKENLGHYGDMQFGWGILILGIGTIIVAWRCRATHGLRPHRLAAIGIVFALMGIDKILMPFGDDHRIAWICSAIFAAWLLIWRR